MSFVEDDWCYSRPSGLPAAITANSTIQSCDFADLQFRWHSLQQISVWSLELHTCFATGQCRFLEVWSPFPVADSLYQYSSKSHSLITYDSLMTFSLSGDICETLGFLLCSTVPLIKVFPWILFRSINFVQMTWGSVTKVYDLDIWRIFVNQFAPRGFLSQFTNHWFCIILIMVVLSGEILALVSVKDLRNYKTAKKKNNWNWLGCQIAPDPSWSVLDEPRRQANEPVKNVNVQNSEQASTWIYIREICQHQFHSQT